MREMGYYEILELPPVGGLTGDPSALVLVSRLLEAEATLEKVSDLAQQSTSYGEFRSLIDFLLVELMPEFRGPCLGFYEGTGKPFLHMCSPEGILSVDEQVRDALQILTSREWSSWGHFKKTYKAEMNWEPL